MWSLMLTAVLAADPAVRTVEGPVGPAGHLVVVGGGTTLNAVIERTLELAGGSTARVAILAAANPQGGPGSMSQWKRAGAASVQLINPNRPPAAIRMIREADLIWMPGGLQGVFMNSISETGIAEAVSERYRAGAVVGGTSAGAAVLSRKMIGGVSDLDSLRAGEAPFLMDGLGLWPDVIVDQHFLQKGRFNRLSLAVLDYPELVGVGIDEETAVVVHGRQFEVLGNGNVTVIDARTASREKLVKGEPAAVKNLKVHVLRSGMKFDFRE